MKRNQTDLLKRECDDILKVESAHTLLRNMEEPRLIARRCQGGHCIVSSMKGYPNPYDAILVLIPVDPQTRVTDFLIAAGEQRSFGARREGRTPTLSPEPDFESGASASSAIRAHSFAAQRVCF